jgi:hypothetical protein
VLLSSDFLRRQMGLFCSDSFQGTPQTRGGAGCGEGVSVIAWICLFQRAGAPRRAAQEPGNRARVNGDLSNGVGSAAVLRRGSKV